MNAFGVDLCSRIEAPTIRIRYEDLFQANGLEQLLEFLGHPLRDKVFDDRSERYDRYQYVARGWEDWRVIEKHPETLAVAKELGYDLDGMDDHALRARYTGMSS